MRKTRTLVTVAATALAALLIASSGIEPAVAYSHGGHAFGGGGGKSYSGGGTRSGRASFAGAGQYSHTFKSPSLGSSRVYAYKSHSARHHRHHFRGSGFVYAYPYVDDYYGYSDSCYWLRRRALATGSRYWWDRYYDCINDY